MAPSGSRPFLPTPSWTGLLLLRQPRGSPRFPALACPWGLAQSTAEGRVPADCPLGGEHEGQTARTRTQHRRSQLGGSPLVPLASILQKPRLVDCQGPARGHRWVLAPTTGLGGSRHPGPLSLSHPHSLRGSDKPGLEPRCPPHGSCGTQKGPRKESRGLVSPRSGSPLIVKPSVICTHLIHVVKVNLK